MGSPDASVRYCAPELLLPEKLTKDLKRKPTDKSDVYSLSMVIVEVCMLCGNVVYLDPDGSSPSLQPSRYRFIISAKAVSLP